MGREYGPPVIELAGIREVPGRENEPIQILLNALF